MEDLVNGALKEPSDAMWGYVFKWAAHFPVLFPIYSLLI